MNPSQMTYEFLQGDLLQQAAPMLYREEYQQLHMQTKSAFAALQDGIILGITLFHTRDKQIVLDRIFVVPEHRLRGVGSGMLRFLCSLTESRQQSLLFSFESNGIGDSFYRFVASTHLFTIQRQHGYSALLTEEALSEFCEQYADMPLTPVRFFELNHFARETFLHVLEPGYPEIAQDLHRNHEAYRTDLCCCVVSEGKIQAGCFIQELSDSLELKLLYSLPGKGALAGKALLGTIHELARCQNRKPMHLTAVGDSAVNLLNNFFPARQITSAIYIAYYTGSIR